MANTSNSKIEATNKDFDTLMKAIHTFLNNADRKVGLGNSGVDKYNFTGDSTLPHAISSS
jgi:hypothetical protein